MQNTNKNPQAAGATKGIGLENTSYCNYFDLQRKPTYLPNLLSMEKLYELFSNSVSA